MPISRQAGIRSTAAEASKSKHTGVIHLFQAFKSQKAQVQKYPKYIREEKKRKSKKDDLLLEPWIDYKQALAPSPVVLFCSGSSLSQPILQLLSVPQLPAVTGRVAPCPQGLWAHQKWCERSKQHGANCNKHSGTAHLTQAGLSTAMPTVPVHPCWAAEWTAKQRAWRSSPPRRGHCLELAKGGPDHTASFGLLLQLKVSTTHF